MKKLVLLLLCCFMLGAGYACFQWYQGGKPQPLRTEELLVSPEELLEKKGVSTGEVAQAACVALEKGEYHFFTKASLPKPAGVEYATSWEGLQVLEASVESLNQTAATGRYRLTMKVEKSGSAPFPKGSSAYVLEISLEEKWDHPVIQTFIPEEKWVNQPAWTPSNVRYNSATQVQFLRTFGTREAFASTKELDPGLMLELSIYYASRENPAHLDGGFFDQKSRDEEPPKALTGYTKEQVDAASLSHFGLEGLTTGKASPCYDPSTQSYHLQTRPGHSENERLVSQKEEGNRASCVVESYSDPLQTALTSAIRYDFLKNENNTWQLVSAVETVKE